MPLPGFEPGSQPPQGYILSRLDYKDKNSVFQKLYKHLFFHILNKMVNKEQKCNSCKVKVTSMPGSVKFMCPSCGKKEIIRCTHCRKIAARYKCPDCGFSGPN